jgi:hypothetical protein
LLRCVFLIRYKKGGYFQDFHRLFFAFSLLNFKLDSDFKLTNQLFSTLTAIPI